MSYQYNNAGQRIRMTWPDSQYVTYDYNWADQVTAIRENGAASGVGVLAQFTYDQHGRRASLIRGNGLTTSYSFDAASRLSTLMQDLAGTAHDRTLTFTHNPADQIASRTDSNPNAYAWTDFVDFTENATHNGLNQILSVTNQSTAPDYDDRGNMTRDHLGETYGYDNYNRLTDVGGSSNIGLVYDPAGRLHATTGTGVTLREMLYDGLDLIAEYDNTGTMQARYVHGPGMDEPLVQYVGSSLSTRQWLHADERGSIVAVSNASGGAVQINSYDEYGVPESSNAGRFGYTGQVWLPETGLYHYKNRAYNPELGRFMQTDPIGVAGGMNLYAYVGGDPVNLVDPLGLDPFDSGYVPPPCPPGGDCIGVTAPRPYRPFHNQRFIKQFIEATLNFPIYRFVDQYGNPWDGGAGSEDSCGGATPYYGQELQGVAGTQVGTMGSGPAGWLDRMVASGVASTISNASQSADREIAWSFYASTAGSSLNGWDPSTPVYMGTPQYHDRSGSSPMRTSYPAGGNIRVGLGHSHGAWEPGIQGPSDTDRGWSMPHVLIDDDLSTWTRSAGPYGRWTESDAAIDGFQCRNE